MNRIAKLAIVMTLAGGTALAAMPAQAAGVSIGIGLPGIGVGVGAPPPAYGPGPCADPNYRYYNPGYCGAPCALRIAKLASNWTGSRHCEPASICWRLAVLELLKARPPLCSRRCCPSMLPCATYDGSSAAWEP